MPTLCGAAITLRKNSEKHSVWRPATIGGVILLDDRPYALTVAHTFLAPRSRTSTGCCDKCDADDYNGSAAPPSGTTWWDMLSALRDIPDAKPDCPNGRNCAAIERDAEFVVSFKDNRLTRLSISVRLPDLQGEERGMDQVTSGHSKAAWMNLDHGWALFDFGDIPTSQCLNTFHDNNKDLSITSVKPFGDDMRIMCGPQEQTLVIATPRGTLEARLRPFVHPERLAGSSDGHSKPAWLINYAQNPGDVGSWMIDPESGQLWGIVVALEDNGPRCSYVLPATVVFDDIKKAMGVRKVTLPGQREEEGQNGEELDDELDGDDDDEDESQGGGGSRSEEGPDGEL